MDCIFPYIDVIANLNFKRFFLVEEESMPQRPTNVIMWPCRIVLLIDFLAFILSIPTSSIPPTEHDIHTCTCAHVCTCCAHTHMLTDKSICLPFRIHSLPFFIFSIPCLGGRWKLTSANSLFRLPCWAASLWEL